MSVWWYIYGDRFSVVTPQLIRFSCRLANVSHLLTVLAFPLLVRFIAKPGKINPPQHYLIFFFHDYLPNFLLPWLTNKENNIIYYNFHRDHLFLGSRYSRSPHRVGLSAKCVSFTSARIIWKSQSSPCLSAELIISLIMMILVHLFQLCLCKY